MIFLEYFRRHLNRAITVRLKNEMLVVGVLRNVDHFLNLQMTDAEVKYAEGAQACGPLQTLEVCSIRGSSVKYVDLQGDAELERRISDATLLRFSFDK